MEGDPFDPVSVNGKTLHWKWFYGVVRGYNKYSKTQVSGGVGDVPTTTTTVTITEFWIKQKDGTETPLSFYWEHILVGEGQRVSAVYGFLDGGTSSWVALVNHTTRAWFYLETPRGFVENTGVLKSFPTWWGFIFLLLAGALAFFFFVISGGVGKFLTGERLLWLAAFLIPALIFGAIEVVQRVRVRKAWEVIQPRVATMVGLYLADTDNLEWPDA